LPASYPVVLVYQTIQAIVNASVIPAPQAAYLILKRTSTDVGALMAPVKCDAATAAVASAAANTGESIMKRKTFT